MTYLTLLIPTLYVLLLDYSVYLDAKKLDPEVKYDFKKAATRTLLMLLTMISAMYGIQLPQ